MQSIKKIKTAKFLVLVAFFGVASVISGSWPQIARAEFTRAYDGCFERSSSGSNIVVWLKAPVCSIILTNVDVATITLNITASNLDPQFAVVRNANNEIQPSTGEGNSLVFTATIAANQSTTYTISSWDYTGTETDFWFGAISDTQAQPSGDIPNPVYEGIMQQLNNFHLPFITHSGDLIGGADTDNEEHEAEYALHDAVLTEFNGAVYSIPGDHDAEDDLDQYYSAYYGERNFTFTYGNARFVGISTVDDSIEGKVTDEILTWLSQTLQANTQENLIVLMHHPLVPPAWANSIGVYSAQRQQLAELFTANGVDLIITGDVHGYDYRYVDSTDFPGLTGGFFQLVAGGAGGKITNYDGDHFFVLLHVSAAGIEPWRIDYSDFDFALDYNDDNDGTQSEVSFNVINNSAQVVPYLRAAVNLAPAVTKPYASTSDGNFLPLTSVDLSEGTTRRAKVEIMSAAADSLVTIEVKERYQILTGITNYVDTLGRISFDALPTSSNIPTELHISSASTDTAVQIISWDAITNQRSWSETTAARAKTTFNVTNVLASRQYYFFINSELESKIASDEVGLFTAAAVSAKRERIYELKSAAIVPTQFGVMPFAAGGANLRLYGAQNKLVGSFFTYDSTVSGGFSSVWADLDGDASYELVVVPVSGSVAKVRAYRTSGAFLGGFEPFGGDFVGGVSLTAGDVDGDAIDEVLVAAQEGKKSVVKLYKYDEDDDVFVLMDAWRVFGKKYLGGLELTSGDVDGDGRVEVVAAPRQKKQMLKLYEWDAEGGKIKFTTSQRPFKSANAELGLAVGTGDVDFDGLAEVVVGSLFGDGTVKVYNYKTASKNLKILAKKRNFGSDYDGGVNLAVGDLNGDGSDEIVVTRRGATDTNGTEDDSKTPSKLTTLKLSGSRLHRIGSMKAFGKNYFAGVTVGLADVDGDWKNEIMVARAEQGGKVKELRQKNSGLKLQDAFAVFENGFSGGYSLTQNR